MPSFQTLLIAAIWTAPAGASLPTKVTVGGELKQWHDVVLTLDGPTAAETDQSPNPFTDLRFDVTFTHESGEPSYRVPGYFAADGNAAESSATAGNKWRAHVSPDKAGTWTYAVHFSEGPDAALNGGGNAVAPYNGLTGTFEVGPTDKSGRDLRAHGRLAYVGKHHLRFLGSGEYFLKVGADSPETLLAYEDFDGTVESATRKSRRAPLKTWGPHVRDWRPGDPTWKGGRGKGLIGAINYLADRGMNSISFIPYTAGGDGDNVWPFVSRDERLHYDCSKLDQWEVVFDHATRRGVYLHFKLTERENSGTVLKDHNAMDDGECGRERKLYIREMVARYGHHLALNWNLGEENSQTVRQQQETAAFIAATDPYGHLIVTHTPGPWEEHLKVYPHLLGEQSALTGASLQTRYIADTHRFVVHWTRESAAAGRPWVVANDEQALGPEGTPPDPGYDGYQQTAGPTIHDIRKYALWATLMGGGAGVEFYFGTQHPQDDLNCEDFRSRERTWRYADIARRAFVDHAIPFWRMTNADGLVGATPEENTRYCLAEAGRTYLVYLPDGGTCDLDLSGVDGEFTIRWVDPRNGGGLRRGDVETVRGGGSAAIGGPPSDRSEDWLAIIRRID